MEFHVSGSGDVAGAAGALKDAMGDGDLVTISPEAEINGTTQKTVDPLTAAALILAIPGSLLAVAQLVDRIRSRKKAETLIETAARVSREQGVTVLVKYGDDMVRVESLSPDQLLDVAAMDGGSGETS